MAKDLPYFKFYVSEWTDGSITLEDYHTQGVFINICAFYWSRECDVSTNLLYKKFREDETINNLIELNIIEVEDDKVVIKFLDEQLESKRIKSYKAKISAEARWNKKEEKPVQVKKEPKPKFNFKQELINLGADKQLVDDWLVVRKNKKASNTKTAFNNFKKELDESCKSIDFVLNLCASNSWIGFKAEWVQKENKQKTNKITF